MCFLLCFDLEAERDLWLIDTQPQPRPHAATAPPWPKTHSHKSKPHTHTTGPHYKSPQQSTTPTQARSLPWPNRSTRSSTWSCRKSDSRQWWAGKWFNSRARSWWTHGRRRKRARWATGLDLRNNANPPTIESDHRNPPPVIRQSPSQPTHCRPGYQIIAKKKIK